MAVYILITALSIILAYLVRKREPVKVNSGLGLRGISRQDFLSRICLFAIFCVLVIPEVLRIDTGNDYIKYVEFMHDVYVGALNFVATEPGFNGLVWLLYKASGFENYLLVFGVFAALTVFFFILAIRQQAENFFFTFYLFMMFGYYFQSYNTVRYYLVLAMLLYAQKFLLDRRYVYFLLMLAVAVTFHKSAAIVLVLYPLALVPWKKWQLGLLAVLGCGVFATRSFWLNVALKLYPSYEGTPLVESGVSISWAGIARCIAVIGFALWVKRKNMHRAVNAEENSSAALKFYFFCSLEALYIYIFCSFLPFLSRICYYLTVTQIFFIPMLIRRMPEETEKDIRLKKTIKYIVVIAAALYFAMLIPKLYDPEVQVLPYKIFPFSELPPIFSDVNN